MGDTEASGIGPFFSYSTSHLLLLEVFSGTSAFPETGQPLGREQTALLPFEISQCRSLSLTARVPRHRYFSICCKCDAPSRFIATPFALCLVVALSFAGTFPLGFVVSALVTCLGVFTYRPFVTCSLCLASRSAFKTSGRRRLCSPTTTLSAATGGPFYLRIPVH